MSLKMNRIFISIAMAMVLAATCCAAVLPNPNSMMHLPVRQSGIRDITSEIQPELTDHLDGEVVKRLADIVKTDEKISLFATFGSNALIDDYLRSGKDETASEFLSARNFDSNRLAIEKEQNQFFKAMKARGISFTTGERYDTLINGVEFIVKSGDYAKVASFCRSYGCELSVGEVYYEPQTEVVSNDVNVYGTGIFDSSDSGYDGTGTVVAVLDSGFDYTHTAYQSQPNELAMDIDDVSDRLGDTRASEISAGLTAADVYVSDKIPFAFDYADKDSDVYPLESSHGTHVAAIIAGSDETITGVAPGAQLALMKVFRDVEDGAPSAAILSALEDCVTLGVDVVNMSLGSAAGFTVGEKNIENLVYEKVRSAGISLICAASNDYNSTYNSLKNGNLPLARNPDSATVGSPSTYEAALSVASISGVKTPYLEWNGAPIYYIESSNSGGKEYNFMNLYLGEKQSARVEYVAIGGPGYYGDYRGYDMKGKIALVRRGTITFEEKVINAREAGASALIIYNNVSGDIRMSVGNDAGIPVISVSKDDGDKLATAKSGVLSLSKDNLAGPFMSDFSSWGPTPDLRIKPEITAHGGEIYSAIPGQRYDRMSGTSMAAPNQAGVTTLVRQYVKQKFPALTPLQVTAMVNQLMMSTTDIAFSPTNTPYSVRKQGAGLANLYNAVNTPAYIYVKDEAGNPLDKTKLELGDDLDKVGVYRFGFTVRNISDRAQSYLADAYVLTESIASSLTDRKEATVTQNSKTWSDTVISVKVDGVAVSNRLVSVAANESVDVEMTLTLSDAAKSFINQNFENGTYVEGYVRLDSQAEKGIDLDAPYLAFFGDWTQAPMFDLDIFETDPDARNQGIDQEDKTMADAYSTTPIGGLNLDYINYLGSYYFKQDPSATQIPASREHISITNNSDGVNYIYAVWAGMLRGADKIDISITEKTTGRVIYEKTESKQQKSFNYGASIIQSNIKIGFAAADYDLKNNTQYTVKLDGYLDYRDGGRETNKRNSFEFDFTTDFEAPLVTSVDYRSEYDKDTKKTKVFADIHVYDNHYAMAARLGRVYASGNSLALESYGDYFVPIFGERASDSVVSVELTDYLDGFKQSYNPNTFTVSLYDYAMNAAIYEIPLPDQVGGIHFERDNFMLSQNETYVLNPAVYPDTQWMKTLEYTSSDETVAKVVNGTLFAVGKGTARITARAATSSELNTSATITVTVLGPGDPGYQKFDAPAVQDFRIVGYQTVNAFFGNYSDELQIGFTGDTINFGKKTAVSMFPSEQIQLRYDLKAYFPAQTTIKFTSSDPRILTVTEKDTVVNGKTVLGGLVEARSKGTGSVTATVYVGDKKVYSKSVDVTVKDPYITSGAYLTAYKGMGGVVEIPAHLNLNTISSYAFSLYNFVARDPSKITEESPYFTEQSPLGNNTITDIIIPEGVETIDAFAFANLRKLESVTIPKSCRQINNGAFSGCTSLKIINGLENVQILSENAFRGCTSLENVNLSSAVAIGGGAFENTRLKSVDLPLAQSVGAGAFRNCKSLRSVGFAQKVKIAGEIFAGCTALTEIEINAPVIATGALRGCETLRSITLGKDVQEIGAYAFAGSRITKIMVSSDNPLLKTGPDNKSVLSKDGKVLVALAPNLTGAGFDGTYIVPDGVVAIRDGALAGNQTIVTLDLNGVQTIGARAAEGCAALKSVIGTVSSIGASAFSNCKALTSLPALTGECEIAAGALESTAVTSFVFAPGARIPDGIFRGNSELTSVEIGDGAVIGASAFENCTSLVYVALGEGVRIGDRAFYSCTKLADLDLSKILSVGAYAFSGAISVTGSGASATVSYLTPALTSVDLSAATEIGDGAFTHIVTLAEVKLNATGIAIGAKAFDGCAALIGFYFAKDGIVSVGDYAFRGAPIESFPFAGLTVVGKGAFEQTKIKTAELTALSKVSDRAFFGASALTQVVFKNGVQIGDYAFYNADKLVDVRNFELVIQIGAYAFSGDAVADASGENIVGYRTPRFATADLSGVQCIGDYAFSDSKLTQVVLGDSLTSLGANPFAECQIPEFTRSIRDEIFDVDRVKDTYQVSDTVRVVRGALYQTLPDGGLELVSYSPVSERKAYAVEEGTHRIGDSAFAGAKNLLIADLPYTLLAIGDSAFYGADQLSRVNFGSIQAPILESAYSDALLEAGLVYNATKLSPYFMYNADGTNVCYNSNFVSFVGLVEGLTMAFPKNGRGYDNYIYNKYFEYQIVAATVADDLTRAAIGAIGTIPKNISLKDESIIVAARSAYNLVTDREQQGLVSNYSELVKAENVLKALKGDEPQPTPDVPQIIVKNHLGAIIGLSVALGLALIALGAVSILAIRKKAASHADAIDADSTSDGQE